MYEPTKKLLFMDFHQCLLQTLIDSGLDENITYFLKHLKVSGENQRNRCLKAVTGMKKVSEDYENFRYLLEVFRTISKNISDNLNEQASKKLDFPIEIEDMLFYMLLCSAEIIEYVYHKNWKLLTDKGMTEIENLIDIIDSYASQFGDNKKGFKLLDYYTCDVMYDAKIYFKTMINTNGKGVFYG